MKYFKSTLASSLIFGYNSFLKDFNKPAEVSSELIRSLNVFVALSGFLLILVIVPRAVEVLPRITSSTTKFKSLVGSKNTLLIPVNAPFALAVAVAPDVCPVTVSPTVNAFAEVRAISSVSTFSPTFAVPSVLSINKNPSIDSSNCIADNWSTVYPP